MGAQSALSALLSDIEAGADLADRVGSVDKEILRRLHEAGLRFLTSSAADGATTMTDLALGELCARLGRSCTAVRALVTVQGMVTTAIERWGTSELRERWVPALTTGSTLGAFCLTEAGAGSDAASVETSLRSTGSGFVLNGRKLWVSFGASAELLLVVARSSEGPVAVLVDANADGVRREPVAQELLGMRGAAVAHLVFSDVHLDRAALLGPQTGGLMHVANTALDYGRYTVAWGCVGLAERCVEEASRHALGRKQFGLVIAEHQLVRRLLTRMLVHVRAARAACRVAADARSTRAPNYPLESIMAKYVASRAAVTCASAAIDVCGAVGCTRLLPLERFFRDAKVMQIIEGTDQISELAIAEIPLQDTLTLFPSDDVG